MQIVLMTREPINQKRKQDGIVSRRYHFPHYEIAWEARVQTKSFNQTLISLNPFKRFCASPFCYSHSRSCSLACCVDTCYRCLLEPWNYSGSVTPRLLIIEWLSMDKVNYSRVATVSEKGRRRCLFTQERAAWFPQLPIVTQINFTASRRSLVTFMIPSP